MSYEEIRPPPHDDSARAIPTSSYLIGSLWTGLLLPNDYRDPFYCQLVDAPKMTEAPEAESGYYFPVF
jgi:hypothetical protein